MTTTTTQEPEITIKNLGELVLCNKEIFDWMRSKSLPDNKNPQTLDEFYKEIGFIPDFYSVHLMELNKKEVQAFAFTKIMKSHGAIANKIAYINSEQEYSRETEDTMSGFVRNSISERFAKVLNRTDRFSQTAVNVELFFQREIAETIELSLQRLTRRSKK